MHNDFKLKHSTAVCSYEVYCSVVEMNISFSKLGHKQSEICEFFALHNSAHTVENIKSDCDVCIKWNKHIVKATESRQQYRDDRAKQPILIM